MRVLLVVYDNDSYTHWFPQGLGYVAAVLLAQGHDVEVYNQDMHHYPDEHLTEYLDANRFDVVGISLIAGYSQYRKLLGLSEAINRSKQRPFYILGGYGPAPEPEFFLRKTGADAIVVGEGEETTVELFEKIADKQPLDDVLGIAFMKNGKAQINPRRPLIEDVDSIPFPAFHKFPMEYYRLVRQPNARPDDFIMPVLSGRGCTFKCTFCYRLDPGHRARSDEAIIEEISLLKKDYGINYIQLSDDLLMSSAARTESFCRAIIKSGLNVRWSCNGRLNYMSRDLARLMKEAQCAFLNFGIESMDNQVLKNMKKGLRTDQVIEGLKVTLEAGLSPGINIIFGNIGDTLETLERGVNLILEHMDGCQHRTVRPVTPYPGSPLYYTAIERGFLKDIEDFYENKLVNSDLVSVNFTDLTDDEFHEALLDANLRLISRYYDINKEKTREQAKRLYTTGDPDFRGFRAM